MDLTDGTGLLAECVVTSAQRGQLELAVRARRVIPPPQPAVVVVQAIPKGDRGQLAVELMTEVGADVIVPWAAERCVVRWQGERGERALARWRSTAREAAKQARRSRVPEISDPAGLAGVTDRAAAAACAVLLDPEARAPLAGLAMPGSGDLVLIVGPEGGISPAEARALAGAGAVPARSGPDGDADLHGRGGGGRAAAQPVRPVDLRRGQPGSGWPPARLWLAPPRRPGRAVS